MGFLSNFYDRLHPEPKPTQHSTDKTKGESERAIVSAQVSYEKRVEQATEVHQIVTKLQHEYDRNHFGEMLEKTMRGADNVSRT